MSFVTRKPLSTLLGSMEYQTGSSRASQAGEDQPAAEQVLSTDASLDASERNNETTDAANLSNLRRSHKEEGGAVKNHETLVFKDDDGNSYIWPFELCRSYAMIKPLIEEVYARKDDEYHVGEVREGHYDIITTDGSVILPTVWSFIVKPSTTVQIAWKSETIFRRTSRTPEVEQRSRYSQDKRTVKIINSSRGERLEDYEVIEANESSRTTSEEDENGDESTSTDSTGDEGEADSDLEDPEPRREVLSPTDVDGNRLSFLVDTSRDGNQSPMRRKPGNKGDRVDQSKERKKIFEGHVETMRITKATSIEAEAKMIVRVHTLPGPKSRPLDDSAKLTWYHVQAGRLDFSQFKEVCLSIPDLSPRLRTLTQEILAKVEKHKVKAFLSGSFIEPGTVLRADEKCQPDPQKVIFSCIPYFDLQPPAANLTTGPVDRLFPPRTLMQSFYPYEPVRERDLEQAFRKFGDNESKNLVYVPNMWMMNIGENMVVTSGYKTLAEEMVKSIDILHEDLSQLGSTDITKNTLTDIRLKDWDGSIYLYQLNDCRSFFQMEQKVKVLRLFSSDSSESKGLVIIWHAPEGEKIVTPNDWSSIISRTDLIFIELSLVKHDAAVSLQTKVNTKYLNTAALSAPSSSVPPFFYWPITKEENKKEGMEPHDLVYSDTKNVMQCLEHVEKDMLNETLDKYDTTNVVDESFASTAFYQALPEDSYEHVRAQFRSFSPSAGPACDYSYHAVVILEQCTGIVERSNRFCEVIHQTLELFVSDVDKGTMLRKLWSAVGSIHQLSANVQMRGAIDFNTVDQHSLAHNTGWYVRAGKERNSQQPSADKNFKRSLRRCRRCTSSRPFASFGAAIDHLQAHMDPKKRPEQTTGTPDLTVPAYATEDNAKLSFKDWVVHDAQLKREKSNAGVLAILTQASDHSLKLLNQAKELADGVRNEVNNMSELYTLPHGLFKALRKLLVFYLAIERALYHTEEAYQQEDSSEERHERLDLPYSESGLEVLKKFSKGAHLSLAMARGELCNMVMPEALPDSMQDLSLGPEYICSWLMRRLLVKPLEKQSTVGDMYREYLSTVQFQVNHRPGKRLIRSINLLQEELHILTEVNTWQMKLVQNYMRVLDDSTYAKKIPSRSAMFPYERMLLHSCLDSLTLASEEYNELIRRCGPLSDRTKQSLEINEEDHGKAIMVFTIVTIIFLPLSFVTSYLGMNTSDIRDMASKQSLFWIISIPLTIVTMGSALFISYNGDRMRDAIMSIGNQQSSGSARGISVAQRKRAQKLQNDSNSVLGYASIADEAEYADPRPEYLMVDSRRPVFQARHDTFEPDPQAQALETELKVVQPRAKFQTEAITYKMPAAMSATQPARYRPAAYNTNDRTYKRRPYNYEVDEWYDGRAYPTASMPKRATKYSMTYAIDTLYNEAGDDDGGVQEYSWYNKRRNRHVGRSRGARYNSRNIYDRKRSNGRRDTTEEDREYRIR
ncbi:hypothetical protein GQ44DRAFT_652078 [Phaeosphaeriaceae sp. PMI808]|nr:hypothetical protein GQ44DRAFT_652078 [Phaeosphaeriaceae sp. PMI808]